MEHDRTTDVVLRRDVGGDPRPASRGTSRRQRLRPVPRAALDREERVIKEMLLRMASLIEERIRQTVDALETHDAALALTVIEGDAEINAMQAEALDHVIRTIATQAPVARDLRFLLTLDHIAYELERIGDSIANVAKRVRDVAPHAPIADYVGIPEMGRLAAQILADVGRALVDSDVSVARAVASQDDAIDAHYHRATDELIRPGPGGSGERRARRAPAHRGPLPRADRRPGHEHRRGRGLPGHRRARGPEPMSDARPPIRVLFVCTGNSARSQMAEAILGRLGRGDFDVRSAGTHPGAVNPLTIRALSEIGIDWSAARSKSVVEYPGRALRLRDHGLRPGARGVPGLPRGARVDPLGVRRSGAGAPGPTTSGSPSFGACMGEISVRIKPFAEVARRAHGRAAAPPSERA